MSWQSVLKAPRASKNMTEGVKKIYVLLTTDDKKKLTALLEKYMNDVKAPKWKKGINWRPSKKTLKEFNSFY